jgi:hypothetical protein
MASNSDSIFNLLSYLRRHPSQAQKMAVKENNIVRLKIYPTIKISYAEIYFPQNHLMVNRLTDSFVAKHGELLDYYQAFTTMNNPHYQDVWVTSSFVVPANYFYIELSFE